MKIVIYFFAGLMLLIGVTYGTLRYLRVQQEKVLEEVTAADSLGNTKPLSEKDSLRLALNEYEEMLTGKQSKMDSLLDVLGSKDKQLSSKEEALEKLENMREEQNRKIDKAKEMAKTFEKMAVKEIAPILRNLEDDIVMLIYETTSNRNKKNILLAVGEKRAAAMTRQFINEN